MLGDNPFPRREDTMYLDTIHPKDVPLGRIYPPKDEDLSLKTNDIFKARPYYHTHYLRKLEKPEPEPGQRARTCYPNPLRRPRDLSLTVVDIEGARPAKTQIFKGCRHIDPLQPEYKLPTCRPQLPVSPRRFSGRHTNDISDIEFTSSKIVIPDRNYVRDPNDASDIEYACPNYRGRILQPVRQATNATGADRTLYNSLSVGDINGPKRRIPFRETNPIDPEYTISQATTTSLYTDWNEEKGLYAPQARPSTIGTIPGAKPRKLQWSNGEPQLSLLKEDIAGANPQRWCGEKPIHVYDSMEEKPPITFHDPFDIPGAQVSSLRKGMVTKRNTHPLTPAYTLLDGKRDVLPRYVPRVNADFRLTGANKENLLPPLDQTQSAQTLKQPVPGTPAQKLDQFMD